MAVTRAAPKVGGWSPRSQGQVRSPLGAGALSADPTVGWTEATGHGTQVLVKDEWMRER